MADPSWGFEDPEHPILPQAWTYEIVGLRLEREPADGAEPHLDLTLRRGGDRRVLRFWSPQDLFIDRGGPGRTHGLVILDLRARQLDGLGVQVADFEPSPGTTTFSARAVEELVPPERAGSPFADRFRAETYGRDETVDIGLAPAGGAPDWQTKLPERLFGRLRALASGYELHLLPLLDAVDETRLNALQCAVLADECDLLSRVVNDPLLQQALGELQRLARRCAARPGLELVVDGP